ncbi:hypothetical protein GCM10010234_28440 [Streptomyces hawaiiensis]
MEGTARCQGPAVESQGIDVPSAKHRRAGGAQAIRGRSRVKRAFTCASPVGGMSGQVTRVRPKVRQTVRFPAMERLIPQLMRQVSARGEP